MLDKSINFKNIIMNIEKDKVLETKAILPHGFSFRFLPLLKILKNGARLKHLYLNFLQNLKQRNILKKHIPPYEEELENSCLFISDKNDLFVATAIVLYADSELGHQTSLHWVSVRPEYQGVGLGKAIVQKAMQKFVELEPNCDVWLHTQTWSYIEVRLYHKLGFNISKQGRLLNTNT